MSQTPVYCKIQRDLLGADRFTQHCVNLFGKGLNGHLFTFHISLQGPLSQLIFLLPTARKSTGVTINNECAVFHLSVQSACTITCWNIDPIYT